MPEMSICGPAEVIAIEACPEIGVGEGQVVTATFHHQSGDIFDLQLEGEAETIVVTGTHPFWSLDRSDWTPAAQLQVGETLKTLDGTTTVERIKKRQKSESVYNIEVGTDHVYRIGNSGILVHNDSAGRMSFQVQWGTNQGGPTFSDTVKGTEDCPAVTVEQAVASLDATLAKVVPRKAKEKAASAVAATQNWVCARPPHGVGPEQQDIHRENFEYKKFNDARVDTINRNGINLKE